MVKYNHRKGTGQRDREEPETLCANLFRLLRDVGASCDVILAEGVDTANTGLAFMNRLLRAAGFSHETV